MTQLIPLGPASSSSAASGSTSHSPQASVRLLLTRPTTLLHVTNNPASRNSPRRRTLDRRRSQRRRRLCVSADRPPIPVIPLPDRAEERLVVVQEEQEHVRRVGKSAAHAHSECVAP